MIIGLIDDGKLPNLALMKIATFHKQQGHSVVLRNIHAIGTLKADKLYCSIVFKKSKQVVERLKMMYPDMVVGGTGWDINSKLPAEIEACNPDYDLYSVQDVLVRNSRWTGKAENRRIKAEEIASAGIGFSSRGCIRKCGFCVVPEKEGELRQETPIKDIVNPQSNRIVLLDNNFTADPYAVEKLKEIKNRGLAINITQGIDIRLMTEDLAKALSEVKWWSSVHYAWDIPAQERLVMEGVSILSRYVRKYRHMCYTLVGFNSTFEEDWFRCRKLIEMGVAPLVMLYNETNDVKLRHFARWVNARIYKTCAWEEYTPWKNAQTEQGYLLDIYGAA